MRAGAHVELLISDGIVEEFGGRVEAPARARKTKVGKNGLGAQPPNAAIGRDNGAKTPAMTAAPLTAIDEALAARIKEWRAAEAKRLRVPAYVVLHDRTLIALVHARPENPSQLLEIDGIGPAKVEKFGGAILGCAGSTNPRHRIETQVLRLRSAQDDIEGGHP